MDSSVTPSSTYNLECPISIKWTISEDKLATLKDSTTYGYLDTEWFKALSLPGVKYYLDIFPNGNKEEHRGKARVFLHLRIGNETKIKAVVKFSIESAGFSYNFSHKYDRSKGRGNDICSTPELFDPEKKFIVDGKFTLKCQGIISVEREKLAGNENGINFDADHIGHKLWMNDDKDFTIKVGENSIKAHKNVLALQSPVFKAMLESDMKESNDNQMVIIDFSFNVVQTAIQLCYNCEPSANLNLCDKMGLLQFCDKYDIQRLKICFEAALIKDVSAFSVCQLANCSILSNAIKLERKCAEFLTQCIKAGTPVTDFDILDKDFTHKAISNSFCNIIET